ncbi:MAG: proteasome accessory factor PafA2 family protein [Armatimonadetes bacterium]|nr:proteasome accessory factor PafA2 family protein [Armatimonadota bacterium]MDE2206661.1 proteasome accessory factor PafA2 family protein [Armatimonadota bacterium]
MDVQLLPKIVGADVELANTMLNANGWPQWPHNACRLVIKHVCGTRSVAAGYASDSHYDHGRVWLQNGGCIYIDCDHLEVCTPETRSALDFTAAIHAMYRIADTARARAQAVAPSGCRLELQANTSDGLGTSWGAHLNVLLSAAAWDRLFDRRLDCLLWLASYQASSVLFTGQGKAASWFDADVTYQISQRAEFTTTLIGQQTTFARPLVNSRRETLAGEASAAARLHCISFDSTMCQTATYLKAGVQQLIVAMIEAEVAPEVGCLLRDPVRAFQAYSDDPELRQTAELIGGQHVRAVELQVAFLEAAEGFVRSGRCGDAVPGADRILGVWRWVLEQLSARRLRELEPHLDWLLKRRMLCHALEADHSLTWRSPAIELLDRRYADLNADVGLYFACEANGLTHNIVTEEQIERFVAYPPVDTRASVRAGILARIPSHVTVNFVDWHQISLGQLADVRYRIGMPEPADPAAPNGRATLAEFVRDCAASGSASVSVGQAPAATPCTPKRTVTPAAYTCGDGYPPSHAAQLATITEERQ